MGPGFQAKAGVVAGANRRRRVFRACTVRLMAKPLNQPAATPSHGPAQYVTTPAATPIPHAASTRPLNRLASRQPERAAVLTPPRCPANAVQAVPAATSPTLRPSHARRHRLFGGSGGLGVLSAGVVGRTVRRVARRSALVSTSVSTACIA